MAILISVYNLFRCYCIQTIEKKMTASGFGIYIAVTFIPWIGLSFRIYDILKGNYDPKEDPKILTLLGVWAIGFTFIWILVGGFSDSNSIDCRYWWQLC